MKLKKSDLILILVLLLAAAAGGLFLLFSRHEGTEVVVRINNAVVDRLPLDVDAEKTYELGDGEYNTLVIRDGMARVVEASCPDQICVRNYGSGIRYEGQTIICLPHRLEVSIENGEINDNVPDAVVN